MSVRATSDASGDGQQCDRRNADASPFVGPDARPLEWLVSLDVCSDLVGVCLLFLCINIRLDIAKSDTKRTLICASRATSFRISVEFAETAWQLYRPAIQLFLPHFCQSHIAICHPAAEREVRGVGSVVPRLSS